MAVNSMFGMANRIRYEAIPAVIYTHPEVAMAGRTEEELNPARDPVPKGDRAHGRGRPLPHRERGRHRLRQGAGRRQSGEILGVHAVGDSASEWIVTAAALIETRSPPARLGGVESSRIRRCPKRSAKPS